LLVGLAATLAGCTGGAGGTATPAAPAGPGKRLVATDARTVVASADGAWLAYLDGCREARGQYLPPGTASCDLRVVASVGGDPVRVASAVTTLPQGLAWHSREPVLAALSEYDYLAGSGTLVVWSPAGAAKVAEGVTFHGFVPGDVRVAALSGGKLVSFLPGAAPEWMPGDGKLTSFEINPAWRSLPPGAVASLLRQPSGRPGAAALLAQGRDGKVREIAPAVGDYAFAPGGAAWAFTVAGTQGYDLRLAAGAAAPRPVGRAARVFSFSPDGGTLAAIVDAVPGKQGDLVIVPVAAGGSPSKLGSEVGEMAWAVAARPPRLAFIEGYDPRVRSGTAGAGGPGLPPRTFGKHVTDVAIAPDGLEMAYLQHSTRGGYSVDLLAVPVEGDAPPRPVAGGVFGFAFSPDSRWLYYRTRCTRSAEACDLERAQAGAPANAPLVPEPIAQGVKSFEFDAREAGRLLLGWQRMDRAALDVGVWERGRLTRVDTVVQPGSAHLLGPDGRRVAYVVVDPKRAGVYVADLPAP